MAMLEPFSHAWPPPRRLLVLHDLTPAADHAAWRAGLLARDQGADLCLLHATPRATRLPAAERQLQALGLELSDRLGVAPQVRVMQGAALDAAAQAAGPGTLLVLPAQRGDALRGWLLGTPAERLLRRTHRPVLLVRQPPRAGWRRVLVPVDFGPAAALSLAAAAALARGPRIEVFHALAVRHEVTLRVADVPEEQVRELRQRSADRVRQRLLDLIGRVAGGHVAALPALGFGDASSLVLVKERAMRADLVVLARRPRGALADFLLGGVTQRVLAGARADVLVLPVAAGPARSGIRLGPRPA